MTICIEAGPLSKLAPYDALELFRGRGVHALFVEWSINQANNRLVKNHHYSYSLPLHRPADPNVDIKLKDHWRNPKKDSSCRLSCALD